MSLRAERSEAKQSLRSFSLILRGIKSVIAPARCMNCLQEGSWLCRECVSEIAPHTPACVLCSKPSPRGLTCSRCRKKTNLVGAVSAGPYSAVWLRRGIHWLKFKGIRDIADTLIKLLAPKLTAIAPTEQLRREAILVPVPLHTRKLRQRGFNQSLDLALALEQQTSIPVHDILVRTRATWTQTKLPDNLRKENLTDAFTLSLLSEGLESILKNKRFVILVDDVTTSGSTLVSAASALPEGYQAWGATIAGASRPRPTRRREPRNQTLRTKSTTLLL